MIPDSWTDDVFAPGGRLRGDAFREETIHALARSVEFARRTRWDSVRSPHVFMGLLAACDRGVKFWADRLGADLPRLIDQFAELFLQDEAEEESLVLLHREFLSDNVIRLLRDAYQRSLENDREEISPMDLLISLFTTPNSIVAECFERIGVTAAKLTELAVLAERHSPRSV
jgi:ATP-dependent Clp protease ATP-binding subunit ClpA